MAYVTGLTQDERAFGSKKRVVFTATANQTIFDLGFDIVPGTNVVQVFINGVKQAAGSYTESSRRITLTEGVDAGDLVEVLADVVDYINTDDNRVRVEDTIIGFDPSGYTDGAWVHFAGRDTVGDGFGGPLRFLKGSTISPSGDMVYAVTGGRLVRDLYSSALISYAPPGESSNSRTVQVKLAELRSSADYYTWGSRCFGAGTNVLGNADFVGVENIAFGDSVLPAITTGYANVGVGVDVLTANTTGAFNYAFGVKCLHRNTSGMDNAAFGTYTLYNNTTGGSNCAFGQDGQRYGETGSYNVTTGVQALYNNVTGSYNSAFGNYAARGTANPPDEGAGTGQSPTFLCAFGASAVYNAAGTYNHGFGGRNSLQRDRQLQHCLGRTGWQSHHVRGE